MSGAFLANDSNLLRMMREIEPMINRITSPAVRKTASDIAQLLAPTPSNPDFRYVLRVTQEGNCAAFYTNKRQVGAPIGCSFVDIDRGNTVMAWGAHGVFTCRGDDAEAIPNIVNVIRPPDEINGNCMTSQQLMAH